MTFHRTRGDRGSIPLAVLAVIVVSGIIVALGSVMIAQAKATRGDKNYTQAVQVADAGVQDAVFKANNLADPSLCTTASPCTGTVQGSTYTWTATKLMSGTSHTGYVVTSAGTEKGRKRTVRAELKKVPRFPIAAFGDYGVELKGSNGADSYNSASATPNAPTGNGQVGSNGNVNFNGASTTVDGVVLYNHDASNNTCNANGASGACSNVTVYGYKLDLATAASMKFIDDQIAACTAAAAGGALPDWVASQNANTLNGLSGTPQCFNSMKFDVDTVVTNKPAVVFVKKGISFEQMKSINCSGCSAGSHPVASDLQIFSAGTQDLNNPSNDTEVVGIGNHAYIGAAIYAPRTACLGNPSAAQADVYGALICGSIGRITSGNQGGWAFHYDDALANVGTGGWNVVRVDEVK